MTTSIAEADAGPATLQQEHVTRYARLSENYAIWSIVGILLGTCVPAGLALSGMPWEAAIAMAAGGTMCVVFTRLCSEAGTRRDSAVYVPRSTPVDVAIQAVASFLTLYKDPARTPDGLREAARTMIDRLQAVSDVPLSGIRRDGYHPFGSTYEDEDLEFQWDMVHGAMRELWPMYLGQKEATVPDVQKRIARMVPPLRTILRHANTFDGAIEYGGYDRTALVAPTRKELKAVRGQMPAAAPALPAAEGAATSPARSDDLFTPVEGDINAAATMHVATLRTQIAAFEAADATLFPGTDRQSGRLLVDVHLPDLLKAYRTAHDASQGEERDDVRAQFARTLRTVRDSLDQIMVRHAAEARMALETEARFLESRNGGTPLDAS